MDEFQEDSVGFHPDKEEKQEEEQQPSDQPVLDHMALLEKSTHSQEADSSDEYDTDLEADNATNESGTSLSPAELYRQACRHTGVVPALSFIHQLGEASVNLNHCLMGPLGAKALAVVLQNDAVVTNLELEDNTLQEEGTRYLIEMLQANFTIHSLNLSNNQLGLKGADLISRMLSNNYYIKSIKLSENDFDDSAAKYLVDALRGDYVTKELDLSHNRFSDAAGEYLRYMLDTNEGIEVLNLSWNHLCMRGTVALSAALKVNSTLKELQLSHNGFGLLGAEALGQALNKNSSLRLLDITNNLIDDQAVTLLCKGLITNNTLRVLKLSQNHLTHIGALTLLKTVKKNTESALEQIDISTVLVCETFVELLEEIHQRRPALDVRYSALSSVTRNLSAFPIFKKYLEEHNESIVEFFQTLDQENTMKVSTSAFRKAAKEAEIPLDQHQLEFLIQKFDKKCTATITYRSVYG